MEARWRRIHELYAMESQKSNEAIAMYTRFDEETISMFVVMCDRIMWRWAEEGNPHVIPNQNPEEFLALKRAGIPVDAKIIRESILTDPFMDHSVQWLNKQRNVTENKE